MNIDSIKAEWDDDEAGDDLHDKLFSKKIKKKGKKSKKKLEKLLENDDKQELNKRNSSKLNLTKLSLNITQKLQNILTKPDEINQSHENAEKTNATIHESPKNIRKSAKIKKKNQKKIQNKAVGTKTVQTSPVQLVASGGKMKKKLKRLEKQAKIEKSTMNKERSNRMSLNKIHKLSGLNIANLRTQLAKQLEQGEKKQESLREKMLERLNVAKFRYINEQMYTVDGSSAQKLFNEDPDAFISYHKGYKNQMGKWPINPLDVIIESIKKMSADLVVGDFGCGNGRLSRNIGQKCYSFDLVAVNPDITECDMSKVPLKNDSLDVAVYCLSLMGTNLRDYLFEANRVLKMGGVLKIAEVESRFEDVSIDDFVSILKKYGFKLTWRDLSHDLFYFVDFVKERNVKHKNKLPTLTLKPCLYKKR